jgi:hypothetical protein
MENRVNEACNSLIKSSNYFLSSIIVVIVTIIIAYILPKHYNIIPIFILGSIVLFFTLISACLELGRAGKILQSK